MTKNKTVETGESVEEYIAAITDEKKRKDFSEIVALIEKNSGLDPKMWGPSIVGFGSYHYKNESGREGDSPFTGVSSRANSITLYLGSEFKNRDELISKLGKHKVSGGCFHIKKLEDIDKKILVMMVKNSIEFRKKEHKC